MPSLDYTTECTYKNGISIINGKNYAPGSVVSAIIDVSKAYKKTVALYCYGGGEVVESPTPIAISGFFIETSNYSNFTLSNYIDQKNIVGNISDMNIGFQGNSVNFAYAKISFFDSDRYVRWGFTISSGPVTATARLVSFAKLQSKI